MIIQNFKPEEYKGCKIYYRNFLTHFEYLTIIKEELYVAHITVNPSRNRKILNALRIKKDLYSDNAKKMIVRELRHMAKTTIETILKLKKE